MMDAIISIISIVMTAFTTIVVALIGYQQSKQEKNNARYRELVKQNELLKQEEEEKKLKETEERFDRLEKSVAKLTENVEMIHKECKLQDISKQLTTLHTLNEFNFEYVQSLSGVVTTIGESLMHSTTIEDKTKDSLEQKINLHKTTEEDINKKLYKITI